MTFDPQQLTPPPELMQKLREQGKYWEYEITERDVTEAARWGARQAVDALKHQWPEPFINRPPTEADGDYHGCIQYKFGDLWSYCHVEEWRGEDWLHTPSWQPKPQPTLQEQALELLETRRMEPVPFTISEWALIERALKEQVGEAKE